MICVLVNFISSKKTDFTVACVPTGIKAGVSINPLGVLIFPNLDSANISYKLIKELDDAISIGPILIGLNRPVHILQWGASVEEIVNMAAMSAIDSQRRKRRKKW